MQNDLDVRQRALELADGFVRHLGGGHFGASEPKTVLDRAEQYLTFLTAQPKAKKDQVS